MSKTPFIYRRCFVNCLGAVSEAKHENKKVKGYGSGLHMSVCHRLFVLLGNSIVIIAEDGNIVDTEKSAAKKRSPLGIRRASRITL